MSTERAGGDGIRAQRREQSRRALVDEAARQFAAHGYAAVGLDDVVQAVGMTKGALYHHFGSKADLFRAVLEGVQHEVAARGAAAADAEHDPWTQLEAGCRAFLVASTAPEVQQIMLIDGPAVLGWAQWREMDEAASGRLLAEALTGLVEAGTIAAVPVEPLTRLLSGAMNEAALWLAHSRDPAQDLADTWGALSRLLTALPDRAG